MTDDIEKLERRLTRITAAAGPETPQAIAAELDAEDAELRMGWLALGEVLRRADANQAMPTLRMPSAMAATPVQPVRKAIASTRRHVAMAVMAAALVASLLVALTLPPGQDGSVAKLGGNPSTKVVEPSGAVAAVSPWDEAIDDEIESAGDAVREAQTSLALASASDQIEYQIEMFRMELDANSL